MTTNGALQFENIGDGEQGTQNFTLLQNFGKNSITKCNHHLTIKIEKFRKRKEKKS
jgi:hypothetical protein